MAVLGYIPCRVARRWVTEDLPFQLSQLEQGLVLPQQGAPPRRKEVCRMLGPELVASLWFFMVFKVLPHCPRRKAGRAS